MSWQDDEQIWDNLDEVIMNGYSDMKNFLDSIAEYRSELGAVNRAILFGAIGQFYVTYVESRNETNSPKHSLANALEACMKNPLITKVIGNQMMNIVDKKVGDMK